MSPQDGTVGGANSPVSYETTLHIEEDHICVKENPSGLLYDHWYWYILNAYSNPVSQDFTFSLQNLDICSPTVQVRGLLKGYYAVPQHHTLISLNGHPIDDHTWLSESEYAFSIDIPSSYLIESTIILTENCLHDGDISIDMLLVNWFEIDYDHTYIAENDLPSFDQLDQWEFQVGGFISNTIDIYVVTNPLAPVRILGGSIIPDDSLYQINFEQDFIGERRYLALSPSSWLTPVAITQDVPSNLKDPANGQTIRFEPFFESSCKRTYSKQGRDNSLSYNIQQS
jgi:hypothetical protein